MKAETALFRLNKMLLRNAQTQPMMFVATQTIKDFRVWLEAVAEGEAGAGK